MGFARAMACRECGVESEIAPRYVCERCFGPLEVVYDLEAIGRSLNRHAIAARARTIWRYREFLPAESEQPVSLNEGFTPLLSARNLARRAGVDELYVKNESANPTHSVKDRAVSVAVTKAREFGFTTVACASTGNLANSVAAYAAHAGLRGCVFIPASLERNRIVTSWVYGPEVIPVSGTYDDVNRLCSEIAGRYPWAFVNVNMRPFYAEGDKTLGYEIAEQLGWEAPEHIVVPVASGSLLVKTWKALKEFERLSFIDPVTTKVHAVQAEGCAPVVQAYRLGTLEIRPVKPETMVKSLAIGNPADGAYVLRTLGACGGSAESASDDEARDGIRLLAETEGIFAETAGGVVVSCFLKLVRSGAIKSSDRTVLVVSGTGMKTAEVLEAEAEMAEPVPPTLAEFETLYTGARRGVRG